MLQCVQAQITQSSSIRISKDSKDSTLLAQLGDLYFSQLGFSWIATLGLTLAAYFAIEIVSTVFMRLASWKRAAMTLTLNYKWSERGQSGKFSKLYLL